MASTIEARPAHSTIKGRSSMLRFALKLDALATGGLAVLALTAGPLLVELLGTPLTVLWPTGLFLVCYAAAIWVTATRPSINRTAAWGAVVLNLLWVVASVVLVVGGWLPLTVLGLTFVVAQAIAVPLFADLQLVGLRRARPVAA